MAKDNQLLHVAFIMDGNGRWAKARGLPRTLGHKAGCDDWKQLPVNEYNTEFRSDSPAC